ncbi:rod shape-determining protein RodA, partial [Staphylococcus chromogenes]
MASSRQHTHKSLRHRLDWKLITLILILCVISVMTIHSAMGGGQYSMDFGIRQIFYYILGAVLAFLIMIVSQKKIRKYTFAISFLFIILLIVLILLPDTSLTLIITV